MKVTVKVHESHVNNIRAGLPAYVILDSMPDERFEGVVERVALLPDTQARWGNPNLKVYNTEVHITDRLPDVKPGVSAKSEIIITNIADALSVPIQAVTTLKGRQVVYALEGGKPNPRPVEVGMYNTKFIQIVSGVKEGDRVLLAHRDGSKEEFRVQKVLGFQGLKRFELAEARAGDIVAFTGMKELNVGETITSIQSPTILPLLKIDAPTISMNFRVNDGPFAGKEGKYVTSRNIRERLQREIKSNVALRVEDTAEASAFKVSGRGELHLSVLIETMRREGYELCVSQPQVITQTGPKGELLEPYEHAVIDLEDKYTGPVVEELGRRLGQMKEMRPSGPGRVRLEYRIPSRGLIGYRSQFLTDTRGTGVLYTQLDDYDVWAGAVRSRVNGVLIANEVGETNAYALFSLQDRGVMFVGPGVNVYGGMIVGIHSRDNDLVVNPNKTKKLTNIRSAGADEKLILAPPRAITLEYALEFINDDELVEVTPQSIRLRKSVLDHNVRKRFEKAAEAGLPDDD